MVEPIIPPHVSGYPWGDPIFPNVQPFTYRDGTTYLEILQGLDGYAKTLPELIEKGYADAEGRLAGQITELVADVNTALASQAGDVNAALDSQAERVETALTEQESTVVARLASQAAEVAATLAALQAESIEFSDPVMDAIITDPDTITSSRLRGLFSANRVHVVVGWGQSNMAGRGVLGDRGAGYAPNNRIWQFGSNHRSLSVAVPWLDHVDGRLYNVGPMYDFAVRLLADIPDGDIVLLVPGAQGGAGMARTSTPTWNTTIDSLYARGMSQLREAIVEASLKWSDYTVTVEALLWHQGESDDTLTEYMREFNKLLAGFRGEFGSTVPLIIGQMWNARIILNSMPVNQAHALLGNNTPYAGFARMNFSPLNNIGDGTHFSAAGQASMASSMYSVFKGIVAGKRQFSALVGAAGARLAGFTASEIPTGDVTNDALGNPLHFFSTTISGNASFINSGGVTLDPDRPGAGTNLILLNAGYSTGVEVSRQLYSGYGVNNAIYLAFNNVYEYVAIINREGKFAMIHRKDGVTNTLAVSELDWTPSLVSFRMSGAMVDGKHVGNNIPMGGTFPAAMPPEYTPGTLFGMGVPVAEAGLTKINRLEISAIVDRV